MLDCFVHLVSDTALLLYSLTIALRLLFAPNDLFSLLFFLRRCILSFECFFMALITSGLS